MRDVGDGSGPFRGGGPSRIHGSLQPIGCIGLVGQSPMRARFLRSGVTDFQRTDRRGWRSQDKASQQTLEGVRD
jgi:hypothetical protein